MPTAPTNITALPTPPSRTDPVNFPARADAFVAQMPTFGTQANALAANVYANALEVLANANATQADRALAQAALASIVAANPAANAAAAAASAAAAAVSAAQAQAVSPDSPVRFNSRRISAPLTIPSAYNASSVGPIAIDDGITVTVQDFATWSIQ
jgi:hypothetical protein